MDERKKNESDGGDSLLSRAAAVMESCFVVDKDDASWVGQGHFHPYSPAIRMYSSIGWHSRRIYRLTDR